MDDEKNKNETSSFIMGHKSSFIIGHKSIEDKFGILSTIGLFLPTPICNYKSIFKNSKYGWVFTITMGNIPLGWIMIVVSLIISLLVNKIL